MNIWMLAWKTLFRRKSRAVFTGLRPGAGPAGRHLFAAKEIAWKPAGSGPV